MLQSDRCESCGMPLSTDDDHALGDPSIPWCRFCTTADGSLQSRDERLERFTAWIARDGVDREAARERAIAHMRAMPAWKDAFPES